MNNLKKWYMNSSGIVHEHLFMSSSGIVQEYINLISTDDHVTNDGHVIKTFSFD